jgi:5-methyltetrahydrofolate--homocysteine methyltransferase
MTTLTSPNGPLVIGPGKPTVLVNDQLRVMDQEPRMLEELRAGKMDFLLEAAQQGQRAGMDMVDILLAHIDLDEAELLPRAAGAVQEQLGCPISLDTRDPLALEAALKALQPYKCLVNSISAEPDPLETLVPIAARYQAAVVAMPVGGAGIPATVEERLEQTSVILEACRSAGIPEEDIVVDAICMASSALPDSMQVTLETLQALEEELNLATILGIGNAGFGMPEQTVIDLAYLIAAVPWGLHSALVDPSTSGLLETVRAVDFLTNRDAYGERYIQLYREQIARKKESI